MISPDRARRHGLVWLAMLLGVVGCGDPRTGGSPQPKRSGEPSSKLRAVDPETGIAYLLEGRELTIALTPTTTATAERALRAQRIVLICAPRRQLGPNAPSATATARFPTGARSLTVRLREEPGRPVAFCGIEGSKSGDVSFVFFERSR